MSRTQAKVSAMIAALGVSLMVPGCALHNVRVRMPVRIPLVHAEDRASAEAVAKLPLAPDCAGQCTNQYASLCPISQAEDRAVSWDAATAGDPPLAPGCAVPCTNQNASPCPIASTEGRASWEMPTDWDPRLCRSPPLPRLRIRQSRNPPPQPCRTRNRRRKATSLPKRSRRNRV